LLYSYYPTKKNSEYLVKNTFSSLLESIEYFLEEPEFCNDDVKLILNSLIKYISKNSHFLFPFMLLNHVLVSKYEKENKSEFNFYLRNFINNIDEIENHGKFIKYSSTIFSEEYWKICKSVVTDTFQEEVFLEPPSEENFEQTCANIEIALDEIEKISQPFFEEISTFVSSYLIIKSNRFIAGSSFPLIGLIGLSEKLSVEKLIELIVHESAHQYIYHLTVFDGLCEGVGAFKSPLRKDPRPIEGIYHATFVLSRLIAFYAEAKANSSLISEEVINNLLKNYQMKFEDGYQTIMKHGLLSELGRKLIVSCNIGVKNNLM